MLIIVGVVCVLLCFMIMIVVVDVVCGVMDVMIDMVMVDVVLISWPDIEKGSHTYVVMCNV